MSTISSGTTSTTTLVHSGDTTGSLVFKTNDTGSGGTTALTLDTSQNATFVGNVNTGSGKKYQVGSSTVSALAWANFNGTSSGTITPRANYNVNSVTKNATGDYTLNFTNALSDTNYCFIGSTTGATTSNTTRAIVVKGSDAGGATTKTTLALTIQTGGSAGATLVDMAEIYVAIFGN
jgi:hypothetical protein